MKKNKITIVGSGNMGGSIVDGLLKSGYAEASDICAVDKKEKIIEAMKQKGVCTSMDAVQATIDADIIIVSVKPYHIESVLAEIKPNLSGKILISIVAGVELKTIKEKVGDDVYLFRVMPNTAIAIQESMTCIASNGNPEEKTKIVFELFDQLGETMIIPEELMPAATVLTACGIAYALRYIRAAMQGGIEIGFGAEVAQYITAQTVKGATELILQSGQHPEREIDKVTTPMGVTITGLNEMEHKGFSSSLIQGVIASYKKMGKG